MLFLAFIGILAILFFVLPKKEYSENEKKYLSEFPEFTAEAIASGKFSQDLDTYTADHFPFREQFVGLNAYTELYTGRNGVSGIYRGSDGYLIAAAEDFDPKRTQTNVERFAQFAQQANVPASLMIVPTTGYIMSEKLPSNHRPYHDTEIFSLAQEYAGDMNFIDLRAVFMGARDETQLYYKTDHHVTSAGAYLMYQQFCRAGQMEAVSFSCTETYDGFYGTTYSRSGLWGTEPDRLEIWTPSNTGKYEVTIDDGKGEEKSNSLYFREHLEEMDQYPVFLDGNHSLVTIENKNCQNGKKLLLIKDSFAHCFATFAIENYEEICMVDLRYFRGSVMELLEEHGLNEILYLYGADNLSTSTDTAWLIP